MRNAGSEQMVPRQEQDVWLAGLYHLALMGLYTCSWPMFDPRSVDC
jgi:hypothetical protein